MQVSYSEGFSNPCLIESIKKLSHQDIAETSLQTPLFSTARLFLVFVQCVNFGAHLLAIFSRMCDVENKDSLGFHARFLLSSLRPEKMF